MTKVKENLQVMLAFSGGMSFILAVLVLVTSNISRSRKITVFLLEIFSFLLIVAISLEHLYEGVPGRKAYWIAQLSKFFDSFFVHCAIIAFSLYVKDLIKHSPEGTGPVPVIFWIADAFILIGMGILVFQEITGNFYPLDETNHYIRTSVRYITYVFPLLTILTIIIGIIIYRRKLLKINFLLLLLCQRK